MSGIVFGQYLETEVLHADPVKLIGLLYRGAADAVAAARQHLREGDIRERSRRITQAFEIFDELARTLDHPAGGEISRNLDGLYRYMQGRLLDANAQQQDAPLAEVETLLATLRDAWKEVPALPSNPAQAPKLYLDLEPASEYTPVNCTY